MADRKPPPLVLIDWEDAYSRSDWHTDSEIDSEFNDGGYDCVTVGYLIRDEEGYVVLAARVSFVNGSYGLLQRIPRGMVKKITRLKA